MSLIVTLPPYDDESGLGYYRRLAAENMFSSWRDLITLANIPPNRGALLDEVDTAASSLGIERDWAKFAHRQDLAWRQWGQLRRLKSDAVCPDCLSDESRYLRQSWEHVYVTACPTHRIRLIDQCDACNTFLSPQRQYIDRCSCGHELGALPRLQSTAAQHWLSTLVSSSGKQTGGVQPIMRGIDIDVLGRVIPVLCLHANLDAPTPRRTAAYPKSVSEAVAMLAPLDELLADWPKGFRRHVEKRIAAGKPEARTLSTLLGAWYTSLKKLSQGTTLEPFLKVVLDVANEKFDGVLGLDSTRNMAAEATLYLRSPDAAKEIGVSVFRLQKAIHAGTIEFRTRRFARGQIYELHRREIDRIKQCRNEWLTVDSACERAGVPKVVLERMIAAEVVRSDSYWKEDILKGGLVERQSLTQLSERINRAAQPANVKDNAKLHWAQLTSKRMGDKRAIESAMRAIAAGKIRAVASGHSLGDIAFRRADVGEYFGTPILEAGMSIQELSEATGWHWESIAYWIDTGLLEAQSIKLRGQLCRVVLPHQLLAFRRSFVPLADLARAVGSKSSALAALLPDLELVGAKPQATGASRGGLVRLSELTRLAIAGARAIQSLDREN